MKKRERRDFSGNPDEFRLSLVEHLEELRDRIIRSCVVVSLTWLLGWVEFKPVYDYFNTVVYRSMATSKLKHIDYKEPFHNMTDMFFLKLKLSFLIGVALAFPYIITQIWGFVAPGLKPNEQKPFKKLAPLSFLLFFMGVGFAWMIVPSALQWFMSYLEEFPGTSLYQEPGTMTFFLLKLLMAFGIGFQIPVVVYGLGIAGLLSAETLLSHWRHGATAIFVIAMIVTPSQDPMTMLAMAIPLTILFMISVYAVKLVQKKRPVVDQPEITDYPME